MADLVLHHSALCIATEAPLEGDSKYYAGIPNWAGYKSGIGIGLGFDIGASAISKEQLQKLLTIIGIEQWQIDEFKATCNRTFDQNIPEKKSEALKIVSRLKDQLNIKWTQQQCLDFLELTKGVHNESIKIYFSSSYNKMHDAIKEVFVKVHYGNNLICKNAGKQFDSKFAAAKTVTEQFELAIKALDELIAIYGKNAVYRTQYKGFITFLQKALKTIQSGGKVIINHEPASVEDLLKDDTFDVVADVSKTVGIESTIIKHGENSPQVKDVESYYNTYHNFNALKNAVKNTRNNQGIVPSKVSKNDINNSLEVLGGQKFIILKAQEKLVELGCYERAGISGGMANADGAFGNNTAKAIKQFQKENKLPETGQLDNKTKELLLNMKESNVFSDAINSLKENILNVFGKDEKPEPTPNPKPNPKTDFKDIFQNAMKSGKGNITSPVGVGGSNKPEDVAVVKGLLAKLGYYFVNPAALVMNSFMGGENFGEANPELNAAIQKLQKDNNLAYQDGRIDQGGATLAILNGGKLPTNTQNTNPNINPSPQPEEPQGKDGVKKLQQLLINEGLLQATYVSAATGTAISSADGIWGKASATALAKYQQKYGLPLSGKPDATTLDFIKNTNKPKEEEFATPEVQAGSGFYPCFN